MKTGISVPSGLFLLSTAFVFGCATETEDAGWIRFKMVNPGQSVASTTQYPRSKSSNPPLPEEKTKTILTGIKAGVGDIWVSQGEVKAGQSDDLDWIRLTDVTNTQLKSFDDYSLAPKEVPAGTYRSIKISLRNIFYWQTELASDPTVKYELLQTMGSATDPCDQSDNSWVKPNYFSDDGNHNLDDDGKFKLVAPGEKVGGFEVEPGKTAVVSWRWLMAGCIFYLNDENKNSTFDCGIDTIEDECPPSLEHMFDFLVEYE